MDWTDWIMIAAVFSGPLVAVRTTRWLDDQKEVRGRKLALYKTLMATRATNLASAHVEALNVIDITFSGGGRKDRAVRLAWKALLDLLGDTTIQPERWAELRADLMVDLLYEMGKSLGYNFDKVDLKRGIYLPGAHIEMEQEQHDVRKGLKEVLEGRRFLPIMVVKLPPTFPDAEPPSPKD